MNKLATAFGGLLMLGAVLAPLAMAHGDGGAALPTAPAGYNSGTSDVSGMYYGSASAWAQLDAYSLGTVGPAPGCPAPTSVPQVDALVCSLVLNLDPSFTLAAANSLCDMEVLGDGTAPSAADEGVVDGTSHAGNSLPDGVFNDGGIGAACHTYAGFYGETSYNSNGCPAHTVTAKDLVSPTTWISATCDSTSPVSTDPLLTQLLGVESCAANDALSGSALAAVNCVTYFTDCNGLTMGGSCTPTTSVTCVPDGVADATSDGVSGVPSYPGVASGCTDGSEAAFVWNSVQVGLSGTTPSVNVVSATTTGWIQ